MNHHFLSVSALERIPCISIFVHWGWLVLSRRLHVIPCRVRASHVWELGFHGLHFPIHALKPFDKLLYRSPLPLDKPLEKVDVGVSFPKSFIRYGLVIGLEVISRLAINRPTNFAVVEAEYLKDSPNVVVPLRYRKHCFIAAPWDSFGLCIYRLNTPTTKDKSGLLVFTYTLTIFSWIWSSSLLFIVQTLKIKRHFLTTY